VGVDWDWANEETDELKYIWFKLNYAYVGENNFSWDAVITTYAPGTTEARELAFMEESYNVDQEAHQFIIEAGDTTITKDYVTYGAINYPQRLEGTQDVLLSVSGSDYWNRPNGSGTQSITKGGYSAIPSTLSNGNPPYINPLGLIEPSYGSGPMGDYLYTFTAGNSLIDLRVGFVALTEAAYAWEGTNTSTYSTNYTGTDGVFAASYSAEEVKVAFSLMFGGEEILSEDVAEYNRREPYTSSSAILSKYSFILPNKYTAVLTRDPNLVYGDNGRMPNGTFTDTYVWKDAYWETTWPLDGSANTSWFAVSSDLNWHYYGSPLSYRFVYFYPGQTGCCPDPLSINLLGNGTDYVDAFTVTEIPNPLTNLPSMRGWALLKAYNQ
jgi:hypothetical protein